MYWLDKNLNAPQQPVVGVSWHDAGAFADWLSKITGERYRLPTEAEWEAAGRGGLTGQAFPWGNQPPDEDGRFPANYNPNPYDKDGFTYAAPVGSFPPNGYGLFDMAGNVAEWCGDWYEATYYARSPYQDPEGPPTGTYRVIRGGSWYSRARELRARPGNISDHPAATGSSVFGWPARFSRNSCLKSGFSLLSELFLGQT